MAANAKTVAAWMLRELEDSNWLYQEMAVYKIRSKFGSEFVYQNQNGNLAISPAVLKEFRRLTEGTVVWDRSGRMWRKRRPHDPEGRQVEYT
jgi:hypothetical protein